ncbi:hypothetical protein HAX54_034042 [Datura stramonium]|uniref:Uncharacterized protein n=1 Tax=Datura stramonium TaxID=4076 RepID=A0ABS8VFX3_DATST|nr:hypothetical protein [Datura stramonium]
MFLTNDRVEAWLTLNLKDLLLDKYLWQNPLDSTVVASKCANVVAGAGSVKTSASVINIRHLAGKSYIEYRTDDLDDAPVFFKRGNPEPEVVGLIL